MMRMTRRQFLAAGLSGACTSQCWATGIRDRTTSLRIAAADRGGIESLLALGVIPVGSMSREGYEEMGGTPPMPPGIIDIGAPVEPNLEVLKELKPDLIVTGMLDGASCERLARIAPVFSMKIFNGKAGVYDRARSEFLRLADYIGRSNAGRAYVDDVAAKIQAIAAPLSGEKLRPAYLTVLDPGGRNITLYGRNCIMYDVMTRIGIPVAWNGPVDYFGGQAVGLEHLAEVPDATLLYAKLGVGTDIALSRLNRSPLWSRLPMVRAGRVYPVRMFDVLGSFPVAPAFSDGLRTYLASGKARYV
ncbi:ABC transporter substrate-binding protein [Burkholderia stagnalis]